jgi:hypothetical protein
MEQSPPDKLRRCEQQSRTAPAGYLRGPFWVKNMSQVLDLQDCDVPISDPRYAREQKGARRNVRVTLGITCLASGVEANLQPGPFEVRAGRGYRQLWVVRTVKSASGF